MTTTSVLRRTPAAGGEGVSGSGGCVDIEGAHVAGRRHVAAVGRVGREASLAHPAESQRRRIPSDGAVRQRSSRRCPAAHHRDDCGLYRMVYSCMQVCIQIRVPWHPRRPMPTLAPHVAAALTRALPVIAGLSVAVSAQQPPRPLSQPPTPRSVRPQELPGPTPSDPTNTTRGLRDRAELEAFLDGLMAGNLADKHVNG